MAKKTVKRIPAPAQDVLTVLDVILQLINVVEAILRLIGNLTGS